MMDKPIIETITGAIILAIAVIFGLYILKFHDASQVNSYHLFAEFDTIEGLKKGSEVRLSGIPIGKIDQISLNEETFQAVIRLELDDKIKLPEDTIAQASSEGLLGGTYLALIPGGEEELLAEGDYFSYTQSPVSLVDLLGKFMFSAGEEKTQ